MNCLENNTERGSSPNTAGRSIHTSQYTCVPSMDFQEHLYIVQLGIIAILPILILTSCNIIIIAKLLKREKKLMTMDSQKDGRNKNTKALAAAMTARTIAISTTQCITAMPIVSMDIYGLFNQATDTIFVMYYVCNTIYYLNNAINVVFYCLLGKSFRQDCGDIFKRKPRYDVSVNARQHTSVETVSSSVLSSVM